VWFVRKVVILLLSRDWVDLRTARQSVAIGLGPKRRRCHVPLLENPTYYLPYCLILKLFLKYIAMDMLLGRMKVI